jgi:hypothetical protein
MNLHASSSFKALIDARPSSQGSPVSSVTHFFKRDLRRRVDLSEFGAPQQLGIHGDDNGTQ